MSRLTQMLILAKRLDFLTVLSLKDLKGEEGERFLHEAFPYYEGLTNHEPKLKFKEFAALVRFAVQRSITFNPLTFMDTKLGIRQPLSAETA